MRYVSFGVAFAVLIPSVVRAQNPQFVGCRTLETAGNFVGPDEALVNGMVCKVVKPEGTVGATEDEKHKALLGIIEPKILRSKPKPDKNPPMEAPVPGGAAAVHSPTNSGGAIAPQMPGFERIPEGSLGNIARAYRKISQNSAAIVPEVVAGPVAEEKPKTTSSPPAWEMGTSLAGQPNSNAAQIVTEKMPGAAAKPEATSETPPAPVSVAATGRPQAAKAELLEAPHVRRSEVKPGEIPGTEASASVIRAEPLQGAKTEVLAAPETLSQVNTETNLPALGATPTMSPEPKADKKTEVFATKHTPPSQAQPEVSAPAANAAKDETLLEQQQAVKLGGFLIPQTLPPEMNSPSQPDTYGTAQEDVFNEGQHAGCVKNVSLGSLDKERLFLAIPEWATRWYEKNQKRFPEICFSDSPMPGAKNYLIVFYISAPLLSGGKPLAKMPASADANVPSVSVIGTFTTSYGSTWHYTYERTVTTTVTTLSAEKVPHNLPSTVSCARAYSEQGIPVSQHWPAATASWNKQRSSPAKNRDALSAEATTITRLLDEMVEDISKH